MTARGTALLVALLATLAGWLWVVERRSAPALPAQPAPLLSAPPDAVARVELAEGERRLTAVRGEQGWTDVAGRPWSQGPVSDLLAALGTLRPLATVDPDPATPGDYGLGPGARRLELAAADGRPLLALELGERNPAWTGLYARRAGEPAVLLVGGVLDWEVAKLRHAAPGSDP
jgi:Domain of unknown function (DUF4340)